MAAQPARHRLGEDGQVVGADAQHGLRVLHHAQARAHAAAGAAHATAHHRHRLLGTPRHAAQAGGEDGHAQGVARALTVGCAVDDGRIFRGVAADGVERLPQAVRANTSAAPCSAHRELLPTLCGRSHIRTRRREAGSRRGLRPWNLLLSESILRQLSPTAGRSPDCSRGGIASDRQSTILELETGVLLVQRCDPKQGALLRTWVDHHVLPAFSGRALPVDTAVAQRCAALHVPDPRTERDAWIAATAVVYNMIVVTGNVAEFAATGVPLINPWDTVARPGGRGVR